MRIRYLLALIALLDGHNRFVWGANETNSMGGALDGYAFTLATGNEGGIYYAFGQAISNYASRDSCDIRVLASKGSVENLKQLVAGQVDLCLAQSDIRISQTIMA